MGTSFYQSIYENDFWIEMDIWGALLHPNFEKHPYPWCHMPVGNLKDYRTVDGRWDFFPDAMAVWNRISVPEVFGRKNYLKPPKAPIFEGKKHPCATKAIH